MEWQNIIKSICTLGLPLLLIVPGSAVAQQAQISKLNNVAFGTISNFSIDQINSQSICVYSTGATVRRQYDVTASGSGTGGAFTLGSGSNQLPYEVQWSDTANQAVGASLTAKVALTGLDSTATQSTCSSGPATTASLIILLRKAAIGTASSGTYTGTLTILISPS